MARPKTLRGAMEPIQYLEVIQKEGLKLDFHFRAKIAALLYFTTRVKASGESQVRMALAPEIHELK